MPDTPQLLLFVAAGLLLNLSPGPDVLYIVSHALRSGARAGVVAGLGITAGCFVHVFAAALGVSALLAASATAFTVLKWIGAAYLVWVGVRLLVASRGGAPTPALPQRGREQGTPTPALPRKGREQGAPTPALPRKGREREDHRHASAGGSPQAVCSQDPRHPRAGGGPESARSAQPAPLEAAPSAATPSLPAIFRGGFLTNVLNPKVAIFFLAFVPQFIAPDSSHKALAFVLLGTLFNINSVAVNTGWALAAAWLARRGGLQRGMHWLDRAAGAMFLAFGLRLAIADNPTR